MKLSTGRSLGSKQHTTDTESTDYPRQHTTTTNFTDDAFVLEDHIYENIDHLALSQDMMRSLNVHLLVLNVLRLPYAAERKTTFRRCYTFLVAFCTRHPRNQQALLSEDPSCSLFVKHLPLHVGSDRAVHELFRDNYETAVQVTDNICDIFVSMLADDRHGEQLQFLKGLCIVNGIPVPRNQTLLMGSIMAQHNGLTPTPAPPLGLTPTSAPPRWVPEHEFFFLLRDRP